MSRPDEPTEAAVNEAIVRRALIAYSGARSIRIVATGPDGEAVLPVPMAPASDDVESMAVAVLKKLRPGEWMKGKTLAVELDVDRANGHFNRVLAALVKRGEVESSQLHGYRLKQPADPQ